MTRKDSPYVRDGRIQRRYDPLTGYPQSYFDTARSYVDWNRVTYLFMPVLVLWITNPFNHFSLISSSPKAFWISGRPKTTNYGLFSLEDSIEGIALVALGRTWDVCSFGDASSGSMCGRLADSLCHTKPLFLWDYYWKNSSASGGKAFQAFFTALADDLVFVVHRVICSLLILSAVWRFCCPRFPLYKRTFFLPSFVDDLATSVVWKCTESTLLWDLATQNLFGYPALAEIHRLLPRFRSTSWLVRPTGNDNCDYLIAVVLLVVVIAGGSNMLATRIVHSGKNSKYRGFRLVGFSALTAASLGYLIRSDSKSTVLLLFRQHQQYNIGYVHAYWTQVGWMVVGHPHDWYPRVVVWFLAGFAGALYANFHLEHVQMDVVKDLLGFFGFA